MISSGDARLLQQAHKARDEKGKEAVYRGYSGSELAKYLEDEREMEKLLLKEMVHLCRTELLLLAQSMVEQGMVTPTKGIGKSVFGYFLLYKWACEQRRVVETFKQEAGSYIKLCMDKWDADELYQARELLSLEISNSDMKNRNLQG
ncbi:hypothetical protein JKP88DRAFT_284223 [Tribonema minus]|uniref:Uncharacterized protein n=1 Tax=Tribonema minus TaxID=303371 RepID=A0A835ZK20_9STRA|nr:hypothetical protein JKP88DRAFT_284223 [Tribonema minus]